MSGREVSGLLVLVLLIYCTLLNVQGTTATNIECTPVKRCPMAMKLIRQKPYAPETISFLRYSHCGFHGSEAMVWCAKFLFCKTPDSKNGTCVNVKKCDSFVHFMQNVDTSDPIVKKYLREFRCNTEFDDEIKVCCPEEKHRFQHDFDDFLYPFIRVHKNFKDRFLNMLPNPKRKECGKQSNENKIFGGTETYLDEYPWMALLKYQNKGKITYACSGSLINERYILTAAHCVDPAITRRKEIGDLYRVVLGEYDTRNETDCIYQKYGKDCADPPQEFRVDNVLIHPEFNAKKMLNDIAIIKIDRDAKFTDYVHPICLPSKNVTLKGNETFSISGWGRTPAYKRSPVKLKTTVKYTDRANCDRLSEFKLKSTQVCVGEGKGKDNCYGDSGGPLMLETKVGENVLMFAVGIISYGYGQICGAFPGVYTYIPPYIDWINENIT